MNEDSPRDGVGRANDAQQSAHREFPSRSSRRRRAAHPHLHHRAGQQPGASRNSSAPLSEQAEKSEATDSLQPRRSLRSRAASLSRPTLRPTQASRAASRPHWYGTADPRVKDLSPAQKARIRNPRLSMRDHDDAYDATSPTTTLTHMPAIKPITGATPIISTKRSNSSPATSSEGDPAPSRASRAGSSPAVARAHRQPRSRIRMILGRRLRHPPWQRLLRLLPARQLKSRPRRWLAMLARLQN